MKSKSNNPTLRVIPAKKYKKPKYPGHADPNPLEDPTAPAYPFSGNFLRYLAGIGLISFGQTLSAQSVDEIPTPDRNPFGFETLGLPFTPVSFGTGMPERLSEKTVRDVVYRAFTAEGLQWDTTHVWKEKSKEVLLDGYDQQLGIGYVFADYRRLGEGTMRNNHRSSRLDRVKMEDGNWLEETVDKFLQNRDHERWEGWKLEEIQRKGELDKTKKEEFIRYVNDLKNDKEVPRLALENMVMELRVNGYYHEYTKELVQVALELPLGKERDEIIRQVSLLNTQMQAGKQRGDEVTRPLQEDLQELAFQLSIKPYNFGNNARKWVDINSAADLIDKLRYASKPEMLEQVATAIEAAKKGNWKALQRVQEIRNPLVMDLDEIRDLAAREKEDEDFVLVLSHHGEATISGVGGYAMAPDSLFADLPDWKTIQSMEGEERNKYRKERMDRQTNYRNRIRKEKEEEKLKNLELQVRGWIRWAKKEGKF